MADADLPLQYLFLLMKFSVLITTITLMYASEVTLMLLLVKFAIKLWQLSSALVLINIRSEVLLKPSG